jgi:hypothetical protein
MGTENATLLCAVPNTNWVNATLFMADRKAVNSRGDREAVEPAKPGTRAVCVLFKRRAVSFLLPGESYLSHILKRLGATR